ncbi:MAG TPA: hypothetical protein VNE58_11860 [Casimicrobiaceae bacterium]|nr:hypothetical protein [Casimicrobiaceae bacterium]
MTRNARIAAIAGAAAIVAASGFWFWQHFASRDAQIDAIHRACLTEFAEGGAKLKSALPGGFLAGLSERLGKMVDGMSGSTADKLCGSVRDACKTDFDGRICTFARDRYL